MTEQERRKETLRRINEAQPMEARVRKLAGEAGELVASVCQWLDDERPDTYRDVLGEIADLKLVVDSLFARQDVGPLLGMKLAERYEHLRTRLDAGEFDGG